MERRSRREDKTHLVAKNNNFSYMLLFVSLHSKYLFNVWCFKSICLSILITEIITFLRKMYTISEEMHILAELIYEHSVNSNLT